MSPILDTSAVLRYDKVSLPKLSLSLPKITRGRVFLLGFLAIALLAIPLTVFMVGQQQNTTTKAERSTTLSFSPVSNSASVGAKVSFDVYASPGSNLVNYIKLVLKYDSALISADESSFTADPNLKLELTQNLTLASDSLSLVLSTQDPTQAIKTDSKLGTVTFDVLQASSSPTQISFDSNLTQIRSVGSTDAISENVFLNGAPATLTITGTSDSASLTPSESEDGKPEILTPSLNETVSDKTPNFEGTAQPNETVKITINSSAPITAQVTADKDGNWSYTPTSALASGNHSITVTATDANGILQTITRNFVVLAAETSPTGTAQSSAPTCNTLEADSLTTGEAPYTLGFSATGSDGDGVVNKATFDFGDGGTQDVTQGGGLGTASVNVSGSHTYQTAGSFSASAILTDDEGGVSDSTSCSLEVTITGSGSAELTPLPPTGPNPAVVGVGVLGGILLLIGTLLFFVL